MTSPKKVQNSYLEAHNQHRELRLFVCISSATHHHILLSINLSLYYYGILQKVVKAMAWVMQKTLKLSGAESLAAAGNIFIGQTEAPLLVTVHL